MYLSASEQLLTLEDTLTSLRIQIDELNKVGGFDDIVGNIEFACDEIVDYMNSITDEAQMECRADMNYICYEYDRERI